MLDLINVPVKMYTLFKQRISKMTYSNKLKDPNELLYCVDYAIANDVDKDRILCIVDALLHYHAGFRDRGIDPEESPKSVVHELIDLSDLSSEQLSMQCDCDDVTLFDVLEHFGSLTYNILNEMRLHIEVI